MKRSVTLLLQVAFGELLTNPALRPTGRGKVVGGECDDGHCPSGGRWQCLDGSVGGGESSPSGRCRGQRRGGQSGRPSTSGGLGRAAARFAYRWQLAHPTDFVRRWRQRLPNDERADSRDELVRRVAADRGLRDGEPVQVVKLP